MSQSGDETMHALVSSLPVMLWETDLTGKVTLSEGGGLAGLGFKPKQLVGKNVHDLYRDNPQILANHQRSLAGEGYSNLSEVNGRFIEARVEPKRDASGQVIGTRGFGVDVTERVRMEQALRGVSRKLWALLEGERERIARELHDEAGQTLTALKLQLDLARTESDPSAVRGRVEKAVDLAATVLEEIRRVARDLKPGAVAELGLKPALDALATRFQELPVALEAPAAVAGLDADMETAVYRFVQECLTNIARHAGAKKALVKLETKKGRLFATVQDDGVGFVPEKALSGPSLGLAGMLERARILGGSVTIDSRPGGGSKVTLELPLTGEGPETRPSTRAR